MKPFGILKTPILLGGLGVALLLSPACKAQEVSPDQFADNNTESWEKPSRPVAPQADKAKSKPAAAPAQTRKAAPAQTVQLTSAHEPSVTPEQSAVAAADKRKTAPRKSNKK